MSSAESEVVVTVPVVMPVVAVPKGYFYVVERLGSCVAWKPGIHLAIPFLYRLKRKLSQTREIRIPFLQPAVTMDGETVYIEADAQIEVKDPVKYACCATHPSYRVAKAIENQIAACVSRMTWAQLVMCRKETETIVAENALKGADVRGVVILWVKMVCSRDIPGSI